MLFLLSLSCQFFRSFDHLSVLYLYLLFVHLSGLLIFLNVYVLANVFIDFNGAI